ncbi:sugar phosphate isomerase/epimerase family protein [Caloranaerobacter sp. DY30410]|uniref:sugar phosphate isomerase/epimerase family protein n=1 Tax=Caloranaerobacter sp. DY30410 TaxID=3238305 RepID=UPI003D04461F
MKEIKISTIITDVKDFDPQIFKENDIGIEIQTFPQTILDDNYEDLIIEFQDKLKEYKGIVSLHGSAFDLNPGSTDRKIIEVTKHRYLQSIEIAKTLGASYVVFHSQTNPLLKIRKIRQVKLNNQIKFWNNLLEELQDDNITLLLENEYDEDYKDLLHLVENIKSEKVKICLDIGHALAYSKLDLSEWISELKEHIKYIHLHWNDRQNDSHNIPLNEELNLLAELLSENNISPVITLEYRVNDILQEVKRLRKIFGKAII